MIYKARRRRRKKQYNERGLLVLLAILLVGGYMKLNTRFLGIYRTYQILLMVGAILLGLVIYLLIRYFKKRRTSINPIKIKYTTKKATTPVQEQNEDVNLDDSIATIQRLRELHNRYFEELIAILFEMNGYKIIRSPIYDELKPKADGGIDLIVEKDGVEVLIQIKKDFRHTTGVKVIREVKGVAKDQHAMVVSSSIFSKQAIEFAKGNNIDLIGYKGILSRIKRLDGKDRKEVEKYINLSQHIDTKFKYKPHTCSKCGAPYVKGWGGKWYCIGGC